MKTRLIISIFIVFISCGKKAENIRFYSLNPPFEEYNYNSFLQNEHQKENRIELLGIEGYNGRNQKYYNSVDSIVTVLGNKYKDKHSIYSIEFYELDKNILKDKKYSYQDLRYGVGKQFTLLLSVSSLTNGVRLSVKTLTTTGKIVKQVILVVEIWFLYQTMSKFNNF